MTTFHVEPALAEALAWRALQGHARAGRPEALGLHHQRAADLYAGPAVGARERAFERLAARELDELGIMAPLADALDERAALAATVDVAFVAEAPAASAEGITFDPRLRRLGVSLQARRFDDPGGLRSWARHALGHTEDVIDPAFAFEPDWDRPTGRARFVERLHALWDVSVDARAPEPPGTAAETLIRKERLRRAHGRAIAAAWPEFAADAPAIVGRLCDEARPSFPRLRRWADDATALAAAMGGIVPVQAGAGPEAGLCPLCRFPSAALESPPPEVAVLAGAEYPRLPPDAPLCGRCIDRYRFALIRGAA
jgi:hypothetical protein